MQGLKNTPLYPEHKNLGAQMAEFGGWLMPIQYSGILSEHKQCRESASLFDICHMGEFYLKGDIAASGIEELVTIPVGKIPLGKCKYGFMLNEKGGVIDDLIIYRLSQNELMIVVNAATIDKDFQTFKKGISDKVHFENISDHTAKLDLQGPLSREVLTKAFGNDFAGLTYFGHKRTELLGVPAIISRTGYTGELGYEIYIDHSKVVEIWKLLLSDSRVKPAGLGARDILRLEVGYSLYGSDIDEETTPIEAGLEYFIDFNKEFTGKKALLEQKEKGLNKVKIAFQAASRRSPRHGYKIYSQGRDSGIVTSGCFSPILSCGIGMGYITPGASAIGNAILLKQDNVEIEAVITGLPFFKDGSIRK